MMRGMRVRIGAVAVAALCSAGGVVAQASDAETVAQRAVVKELFDAMRAGDSTRIRAVFHPSMVALMTSDVGPDGKGRLRATPEPADMAGMPVIKAGRAG